MVLNKKNWKKFGAVSLLLFTVLSTLIVFAGNAFESSAEVAELFKNVTGQIDFSKVMKNNFNSTVVASNQVKTYENRTVIISFSGESLSELAKDKSVADYLSTSQGKNQAEQICAEQNAFLEKLSESGINYTLENRYLAIDNAVAVKVNTRYVKSIREMSGVDSVVIAGAFAYPKTYSGSSEAVNNVTNVYGTGVYDSSAAVLAGVDGSGTVVAILDTGLDYTHPAFLDMPDGTNPIRFTEEYVNGILQLKGLKAEEFSGSTLSLADVYLNAKVPFAYDYADRDTEVYPSYSTHGTHVAGIVAGHDANGYTDKDGNHVDEEFIGVAPEAQLVICKVFTDDLESTDLGGAETEDILAALEDCMLLGVDVINMSLGTSCGFTSTNDGDDEGEYLNRVYNAIGEKGISLVCAASNDFSSGYGGVFGTNLASNPDSGTVGSPATFASALSVASISGKKSNYLIANGNTTVFFEESSDENSNPFDFIKMMIGEQTGSTEFEYVVVPGVGRASDYTNAIKQLFKENSNRIALVKRGDNTFKEKVEIAKSMGAKAIIVYNNVSGTVRMSLGDVDDPIPSASIDMNAGEALVYAAMHHSAEELSAGAINRVGKLTIDSTYKAGPFMSEFSSWGSTPDLKLKPEITAHGGEITSAVPGGYDEQSGTSMASPNMAGVVALVRCYVKQNHPEMTPVEVTQRVNQLLMSTSSTVYDKDGLPYSPRKQGAGLGSLDNSRTTGAYLWTDNIAIDNRPKVELGDDAQKVGVYTVAFLVTNFSEKDLTFKTQSIFMTETLAIDKLSVAEKAYILDDIAAKWVIDGKNLSEGSSFTVSAGETLHIELTVALSNAEKKYIDASFVNGMYVEGFAKLLSETDGQCDMELPFMGFYGDWTKAPMLDYDAYELAKYQQDASILEDEKPQASVWGTQPYLVYSNDEYVIPMGSYVYLLDENADKVYTSMEYNAISCFNEYYGKNDPNNYLTSYKLKGLYAGLLRNARSVDYQLINSDTGEVLESETVNRIGKAYANGGTARPAFVDIPLDPVKYGLVSNGHYRMTFEFWLDYGDGSCTKNTFAYDFTVDYEAPMLEDIRIRYYDYKEGNKNKQKIYLDLDIFDNHYAQSAMLCYLDGDELILTTDYVTPIYNSIKNGTNTVSIEITDIYDKYKDCLYVQLDDYAMNHSVYWLNLSAYNNAVAPKDFSLAKGEDRLTLSMYDTHTVSLENIGETSLSNFRWTSSNRSIADVRNGEIVGISEGNAVITVTGSSGASKAIYVTVKAGDKKLPTPSISFDAVRIGSGALKKAQGTLEVYPGASFKLNIVTDPWYYPIDTLRIVWESTNPKAAQVDDNGNVVLLEKGAAVIKATIVINDQLTAYTATVTLKVKDPFEVNNSSLTKYHGPGGVVVIPTDKNIMMIAEDAFKDNDSITEVVIPKSVNSIGTGAFENCTALKKVYFDSMEEMPIADADINIIYSRAFAGCVSLELVDLSNVKVLTLGNQCFSGCTGLTEIRKMNKIGSAFDYAFAGCTSLKEIDLSGLRVSGYGVFAGCTALTDVNTVWYSSIGTSMFSGCTSLRHIDLRAQTIGNSAFENCTGLRSVKISLPEGESSFTHYIGARAFAGCSALQSFVSEKGCSISTIGDYAFTSTALTGFDFTNGITVLGKNVFSGSHLSEITIGDSFDFATVRLLGMPFDHIRVLLEEGCEKYIIEDGVLFDKNKSTIYCVLSGTTEVVIPDTVISIGDYAFAGSAITSLKVPENVTHIGEGAFENSNLTSIDLSASSLTEIEDRTFAATKLLSVTIPEGIVKIGSSAFEGAELRKVVFVGNSVKELGDRVFAECKGIAEISLPSEISVMGSRVFDGCTSLKTVAMPNVVALGQFTFYRCGALSEVCFAENAATLGNYTFYGNSSLIAVSFGDSVTEIGSYTFSGCSALKEIDLKGVTVVKDNAFSQCVALSEITGLERLTSIGDYAFCNCKSIEKLNLASATEIGVAAFAVENGKGSYTEVSIPVAKKIGNFAFMGGKEIAVNIPGSLENLGYGVFSDSSKLTSFAVNESNKDFFVDNGVLYRNLPNGKYELVSYPSGRSAEDGQYAIIEGTSAIADYAFNRLKKGALEKVILPYSVKTIGVSAFYESGITEYIFYCIEAPTLLTVYREDTVAILQNNATGSQIAINGLYYSNFDTLFARYTEIVGETSALKLAVPENGVGYDNYIYTNYFGKVTTLGVLMDDTTRAAIDSIEKLLPVYTVEGWSSLKVNETNKQMILAFADRVKEARRMYNNILSDEQRAFVSDEILNKLVKIESLMRPLKTKFGIPLVISELKANAGYKKDYEEGEEFSFDGLVLTVVYDDGSTEEADINSLVMKSPSDGILSVYDSFVVFDYCYGENGSLHKEVSIPVNVRDKGEEQPSPSSPSGAEESSEPSSSEKPSEDESDSSALPFVIVSVVLLGGVCVAAVLIIKKGKKESLPKQYDPNKAPHNIPVRKIVKWTVILLACAAVVGVMIVLVQNGVNSGELMKKEIKVEIVYNANGGYFENHSGEKTIGYPEGGYPFDIGHMTALKGSADVSRDGYTFVGWYYPMTDSNGDPVYEDDEKRIVITGDAYDFSNPLAVGDDVTLYALWQRDKTLSVHLVGCGVVTESDKKYEPGDVLCELQANPSGDFVGIDDLAFYLDIEGYTFINYYQDEECTVPVSWPIKIDDVEDGSTPIYARFIEGEWNIVSDVSSATDMLQSLAADGNYFVISDVDLAGAKVDIGDSVKAKIEGNGYTISNFKVAKTVKQGKDTALFGEMKGDACIHDLTLNGVDFTVSLSMDLTSVYFLFSSMPEDADISDFTVDGKMSINLPSDITVKNLQPNLHNHWILPLGESDDDALSGGNIRVTVTCTVGKDAVYSYPDGSADN